MALIVVDPADSGFIGECTLADYVDCLDALVVEARIETPVARQTGGEQSGARTSGLGVHSDIMVARVRDSASPKLAEACSLGTDLGTVFVRLLRQVEGRTENFMTYVLYKAYVSHYDADTLDENGVAYGPHFGPQVDQPSLPASVGVGSTIVMPRSRRLAATSGTGLIRGGATADDIERVWFNATRVDWVYTSFVNGVSSGTVTKSWNIESGQEVQ